MMNVFVACLTVAYKMHCSGMINPFTARVNNGVL